MQPEVELLMCGALVILQRGNRGEGHRPGGKERPQGGQGTLAMKDRVPLSFCAMTMLWTVKTNCASLEMPAGPGGMELSSLGLGCREPSRVYPSPLLTGGQLERHGDAIVHGGALGPGQLGVE